MADRDLHWETIAASPSGEVDLHTTGRVRCVLTDCDGSDVLGTRSAPGVCQVQRGELLMAPWRFEVIGFTIEEIDDHERRPEERLIFNPEVRTITLTTTSGPIRWTVLAAQLDRAIALLTGTGQAE